MPADEIYVVSLAGGLGNQLFQLAFGLSLRGDRLILGTGIFPTGKLTHGSPDIMLWKLPNSVEFKAEYFKEATFIKRAISFILRKCANANFSLRGNLGFKFFNFVGGTIFTIFNRSREKIEFAHGLGYFHRTRDKRKSIHFGYFQSYKWIDDATFSELMALEVQDPTDKTLVNIEIMRNAKTIFVHIRLGDYRTESTFGIPSKDYYSRSINEHLVDQEYEKIVVFSDEPSRAVEYIEDELRSMVEIFDDSGLNSAEVLEIMRHGDAYVIGNSTFSWWAAHLRFNREARVIAPNPWFVGQREPIDLVPPTWTRVMAWRETFERGV